MTPQAEQNADEQQPRVRTLRHELSVRSIALVLATIGGIWLIARVWETVLIMTVALVLAGTFSPVVAWLEQHRIRRSFALTALLFGLFGLVAAVGFLIVPALISQISMLGDSAPVIQARIADIVAAIGPLSGQADAIRTYDPTRLFEPGKAFAVGHAGAVASGLIIAFTTVALAFYLVADQERIRGFAFSLLPRKFHVRTAKVLLDMENVVGGYMRGQAFTSLCMGVFTYILLTVAGVPNPIALAMFAAFADLIPFIGSFLTVVPSVLFALTVNPAAAVGVLVALVVYQQFESHFLVPKVYGNSLRLSPVAVVVALLVGGQLLGILGALLALPLAAGIRVIVENYRIALPGDMPGQSAQNLEDERAEADFEARTEGATAVESAEIATAIASELQNTDETETGLAEVPIEERGDPPFVATPYHNPAR